MTIILGIETSCDESAAALIKDDRTILAHKLLSQEKEHQPFGGVVPEIAARAHVEAIMPLVEAAFAEADMTLDDVDAIAATARPWLNWRSDGRAGDGKGAGHGGAKTAYCGKSFGGTCPVGAIG